MIEWIDPKNAPACKCGALMDVLRADGVWACYKCDPKAKERRERTVRILGLRERILRREGRDE